MIRTITFGISLLVAALSQAAAQDRYPSRAIKFVVPFTAGSATDTLARLLGNHVGATLGQGVIIENTGGGSGVPAALNVARAAPDGYTILITSNTTHASNQSMLKRVPYDAVADFEPISKLGTITLALVGHPSVPANNVQELIAYAKANPGKLTFGAGSTSSRVAGELMKIMAGIDMLHVPYRSNPLVVTDLPGDSPDDEAARTTAGSLVLSSAEAAWENRATVEDLPLFSAFWEREAQLPTATSGDAQFVAGAVNSSEIPERDLSVQLAGWMLMEAAHTVAGQP